MSLDIDRATALALHEQMQHVLQHHRQDDEVLIVHACRHHDPAVSTVHRLFYKGGAPHFIRDVRVPAPAGQCRVVLMTCAEKDGQMLTTARLFLMPLPANDVLAAPCEVCPFIIAQELAAGMREAKAARRAGP